MYKKHQTPSKNLKENSSVITMEKIEEMLEQKFNTKSYLAINNELLSKKINEINGKLNVLQASIEHSDEVNLEKFKAIDRDVSHIKWNLSKPCKKHRRSIIQNRGKVTLLRGQFSKK